MQKKKEERNKAINLLKNIKLKGVSEEPVKLPEYKTAYNPLYYYPNRLFSYDPEKYWFYIVIGSRGRGKTVSAWRWVLKRFINHGEKFVWLRLTETPIKKAARNQSTTIVPHFLLGQLNLISVFMKGTTIYCERMYRGEKITQVCGVMDSISTFYSTKGQDMSQFDNVVFDEINRESGERNTFDVTRAFINQIETIARMRKIRVLMLGNTISDTSEILSIFNFQPKEFGIYKLTRKKTIIEYLEDSEEFKAARRNSMAGVLLGDNDEINSSFTNVAVGYRDSIEKYNQNKPLFIFFINDVKGYGVYERNKEGEQGGLFIGEIRSQDIPKYKISPFLNSHGIYNREIYDSFYELISANLIWFETTMIRSRFVKALKNNRTITS